MKPAAFDYHAPKTLDEALAVLARVAPEEGRVLAGGQSLVPAMALRLALPAHLVDINGVQGLERVAVDGQELAIGACARHAAFERPPAAGSEGGPAAGPAANPASSPASNLLDALLAQVVRHIAHYPIRTRGTFCGSLANADPASEWCLVAATLDAVMVAKSVRGTRRIAAADWFKGAMSTALAPDELLAEARLPLLPADTKFGFCEFSRRAGDFAIAMALATYRVSGGMSGGVMKDPRVGVGGVEGAPRRIPGAERALEGKRPGREAFEAAADAAAQAVAPLEDIRYPTHYRRDVARAMVRRALESAAS